MTKVLILTPDVIKVRLAGPAIRVWEMAKELSRANQVRVVSVTKVGVERSHPDFEVTNLYRAKDLRPQVKWADVVIVQGIVTSQFPFIFHKAKHLVVDLYDPLHLELLEQSVNMQMSTRIPKLFAVTSTLNVQIDHADLLLCASPKQRDFWLGQMAARGRINPLTYDADSELNSLLKIVPFGLDETPPKKERSAIKGVIPGIKEDDQVLLWGGGLYNWFDPITLIHAMHKVQSTFPKARLFFMGSGHPNPNVPNMAIAGEASQLAEDLGLLNKTVFFNDEWVAYEDRAQYLLDADLGVSTHRLHLETEFSFRTRILDYLWAGLPMIVSEGDSFAELVEEHHLGATVKEGAVEDLADAITQLLSDRDRLAETSANVREAAKQFEWPTALAPLLAYVTHPYQAADRKYPRKKPPLWRAFTSSARHGRWGFPVIFLYRVRSYIKRALKQEQ